LNHNTAKLTQLLVYLEMSYKFAQMKLAENNKTERDLRNQIADLVNTQRGTTTLNAESKTEQSWAVLLRWQHWIDDRVEQLNSELARVLAQKPELRATVRNTLRKNESLKGVLESLHKNNKAQEIKKSLYD